MKSNELKQLIRQTVYECVNEILAQKYVQQVVTEAVRASMPAKVQPKAANSKQATVRPSLLEQLEVPNPYKTEQAPPAAGEIPEAAMNELGVFDKDWSKFF